MKTNIAGIVISFILFLGFTALLVVNAAYPELIDHPYQCEINITEVANGICTETKRVSCLKLTLMIVVPLDDGTIDVTKKYINCEETLSACYAKYNNITVPCVYHNSNYDFSKYNGTNIILIITSICYIPAFFIFVFICLLDLLYAKKDL
jgi:hypothetical protein